MESAVSAIITDKHTQRLDAVREAVRERGADAVLLTFLPDIRWACGFTGSNGILLVRPDEAHFVTDGRYFVQAHREVHGAEVHVPGYQLLEHAAKESLLGSARVVLVQGEHVTVNQFDELREQFPEVTFEPATDLLVPYVGRKDDEEVRRIREAQSITDDVFEHLLGIIRPGMTEKEIAAEIVYQHLLRGAEGMSFSPIVAAGPQGALPHARPTDRPLGAHELLVIDMGCFLNGYASDMTRTVAIGTPTEEARKVYDLVLEAQVRAIEEARAGMTSIELDGVARKVIKDGGYGDQFSHGLGHGLGLQIHEWPKVSYHVEVTLPAGAVVTIEPGIYLPEQFGVRIEDIIVLRDDGCENLTGARKDLVVL
ncbi:MAG TPA: Xaa-Pro peptidase family protein [Rhodothermales bacterium]